MRKEGLFLILVGILLTSLICAELDSDRQNRLIYGKVIYIREISINPAQIAPGSSSEVRLSVENVGDFPLKDVIVKLELPPQFTPSIGDTNKKKMRVMDGGAKADFLYKISALPDSESGIYKVPVIIDYINKIGEVVEENVTISLLIGDAPDLMVSASSSDIYNGKDTGTINIKIVNKGLTDLKFMSIELEGTEEFSLSSSNQEYIGDVDSDDFETAEFIVKIPDRRSKIMLPINLEYRDANNKEFTESRNIQLNIPDKADLNGRSSSSTWIIIIILIVVGFFVYRWWKKKKKRIN